MDVKRLDDIYDISCQYSQFIHKSKDPTINGTLQKLFQP